MGYGRLNAYKAVLAAANSGSHTISADLTFYETIALKSGFSVTIPNGRTLTVSSGERLTFNGPVTIPENATVTFSGSGGVEFAGALTIGNGATVSHSGPLYVSGSATVGTNCTLSMSSAVDVTGTLTIGSGATISNFGEPNISGSVTVGSGSTVTINTSTVITGALTLNGTSGSPISVRYPWGGAIYVGPYYGSGGNLYATYTHFYDPNDPDEPTWMGIRKETNSGTIQLTNCEVEDAWRAGLFVSSSSIGPTIQVSNCHFHHCDSAIVIWRAHPYSYIRNTETDNSVWGTGIRLKNTAMSVGASAYPQTWNLIHANRGGFSGKNFTGTLQYSKIYDNDRDPDDYCDNITLDGSSASLYYNTACFTEEPEWPYYERNDMRLIASSPNVAHNWFYGAAWAEIYLSNGSYPQLTIYDVEGYNGIHTDYYDNNDDPPSYTQIAVEWGSSNFASTIFAPYNWWGDDAPDDWDGMFWIGSGWDDSYIDHSSQLSQLPDTTGRFPKVGRAISDELAADRAIMRAGLLAERAEDNATALAAYQRLVAEQPLSPLVHNALERIFSTMTKMGMSQSDVESYFAEQAARSDALNGLALQTAREIRRRTMVFCGDLERAVVAYRAEAENENEHSYDRRMAWYNLAWIADERKDKMLLTEAVGHVLADTTDDAIAEVAIREWGAKIALAKPQAEADTSASSETALLSAEPNPFNPSTTIRYRVDAAGAVRVGIYNVSGQLIRTLIDETREPGTYTIVWDGNDASGRSVASGVYLVRLTTPTRTVTHRVTMIR